MTINSDFCLQKYEKHIMYFSSIPTVKHRLEPGVCCCCCCCLSHFVFVVLYSEYRVKLKRKRITILNWLQRLTAEVSEFKLYDHIDMKESFYIRKAGFHPSQHRFGCCFVVLGHRMWRRVKTLYAKPNLLSHYLIISGPGGLSPSPPFWTKVWPEGLKKTFWETGHPFI